MYFTVDYKPLNRPRKKNIVKAQSSEEASLMFNNPKAIGKTAEIKEVTKAKRIPAGWDVLVQKKGNPFPVTVRTTKEIPLDNPEELVTLKGFKNPVKVSEIVGAFKPSKDKGVMSKGFY